MNKSIQEIVRRTRGRDTSDGAFIDARKVDGNNVLFWKTAANDAAFEIRRMA